MLLPIVLIELKLSMTSLLYCFAQCSPDSPCIADDVDYIPEQLPKRFKDAHGFLSNRHGDGDVSPSRSFDLSFAESKHIAPPMKCKTSKGLYILGSCSASITGLAL